MVREFADLERPLYRQLFIVLTLLSVACAPTFKEVPSIVDGTMDLRAWDFEEDGPVKLDGKWLFAWERLVEPAPWGALRAEMPRLVEVPSRWVKTPVSVDEPDTKLPGVGYATYALRFKAALKLSPIDSVEEPNLSVVLILLDADGERDSVGYPRGRAFKKSHKATESLASSSLTTSASAGLATPSGFHLTSVEQLSACTWGTLE